MIKRALLAFAFVAALGVGSKTMAWSDCNNGGGYGYAYPNYAVGYAGYAPYGGYAPRVSYYPPVPVRSYRGYDGRHNNGHGHHHDHHHNGVSISFGF